MGDTPLDEAAEYLRVTAEFDRYIESSGKRERDARGRTKLLKERMEEIDMQLDASDPKDLSSDHSHVDDTAEMLREYKTARDMFEKIVSARTSVLPPTTDLVEEETLGETDQTSEAILGLNYIVDHIEEMSKKKAENDEMLDRLGVDQK